MNQQTLHTTSPDQWHDGRSRQTLSLVDLVERITGENDLLALQEFHQRRTVFRYRGGRPLLFAQFVDALRQSLLARQLAGWHDDVHERAYDLTIDKFTNLPPAHAEGSALRWPGPDCRCYFRMCLGRMTRLLQANSDLNPLERERQAARILQRHVVRHYYLSCLEAKRGANPAVSRYAWKVNGGVIDLRLPASMPGAQRRKWLETHVDNPDPARPGERQRVQAIADDHLPMPRLLRLDEADDAPARSRHTVDHARLWSFERDITVDGLAKVVAWEKAQNLHQQRPAIRSLGRTKLMQLIVQILGDLGDGNYEEKRLAQLFGLSLSTFSRFAGSRWRKRSDRAIPDLWLNTAHTLASHRALVEAAKDAGVWRRVGQVLQQAAPSPKAVVDHA